MDYWLTVFPEYTMAIQELQKVLSFKILWHSIFTPQVNDKASLITTALKHFCHNLKTDRKDSFVRSCDAICVFRVSKAAI